MLSKIAKFDWNTNNKGSLTVEEILMRRITNDAGEFVTPQTAHIAFAEFKKFMFLNKMYLDSVHKKEETRKDGAQPVAAKKQDYFVGLVAPPLIDAIWVSLMSINIRGEKLNNDGKYFCSLRNSNVTFLIYR